MTRKEYEKEQARLYSIMYDDDAPKDKQEAAWVMSEKLKEQYSHYEKEILQETLDILKGGTTYIPTKRRKIKYSIKFIEE